MTNAELIERLSALTDSTTVEARDAIASVVAKAIACEDFDDGRDLDHAHHLMIAVLSSLFASMLQGVIDGPDDGPAVGATNHLIDKIIGPRLVKLHHKGKRA